MKLYSLKSVDLTEAEFEPYGSVIRIPDERPEYITERFNLWPRLGKMKVQQEIQVGVSTFFKRPLRFAQMERHLKSMEVMLFLNGTFFMPFALAEGNDSSESPKAEKIRIFKFNGLQGVVLARGVWHWTPFPLTEGTSGLFIFETGTELNDLLIRAFGMDDVVEFSAT